MEGSCKHGNEPRNVIFSASGTHFSSGLSEPQGLVRPEGLGNLVYYYRPFNTKCNRNPLSRFGYDTCTGQTILARSRLKWHKYAHNNTRTRNKLSLVLQNTFLVIALSAKQLTRALPCTALNREDFIVTLRLGSQSAMVVL
jgi:hypothetical protein